MTFETSLEALRFHWVAYSIYAMIIISVIAWFAYNLTRKEKAKPLVRIPFYGFIAFLVAGGVGHHIFTYNTMPWVSEDIMRHNITPDKVFKIQANKHAFTLPSDKLEIKADEKVLFDVVSSDLMYGFGLFRQDGSMVAQMQVNPGSRNDLLWTFHECGQFDIRSTEYSGPKKANDMRIRKAVVVTGCEGERS